ncbi:MAG: (2Fe-2S)-binding protein [Bosea sp. (in: a-proteobacteria)]
MFWRLHEAPATLSITVNGVAATACTGDTVATALLLAGQSVFRHTIRSGAARGPYCAMGSCFECLVTIDGQPGMQACLVPVRNGMVIDTLAGAP